MVLALVQAQSKPMLAILDRLKGCGEFEIIIFGDNAILNEPIADWPRCDCLLSWHSDGFPLKKACLPSPQQAGVNGIASG